MGAGNIDVPVSGTAEENQNHGEEGGDLFGPRKPTSPAIVRGTYEQMG